MNAARAVTTISIALMMIAICVSGLLLAIIPFTLRIQGKITTRELFRLDLYPEDAFKIASLADSKLVIAARKTIGICKIVIVTAFVVFLGSLML